MKIASWTMLGMLLANAAAIAQETKPAPPTLPPLPAVSSPPVRRSILAQAPLASPAPAPVTPPAQPVQPRPVAPLTAPITAPYQAGQTIQVTPPQAIAPTTFPSIAGSVPGQLTALKWDSESKEYTSKRGEMEAHFTFFLTNITTSDVSINAVRTSCGCTVAKLPSTPWVVPPAGSGPIDVTVNLAGKSGTITKAVTVESSAGAKSLLVKVNIDGGQPLGVQSNMNDADRLKNMQLALADRQVVFKNQECAKCHADKAKGLADGRQIYHEACAVCHDSTIRASMVPDLKMLTHATDAEYWRNWINYGRAGSMMPAFAQSEGGPLTEAQVNALVSFLVQAYPSRQPATLQKSAALRQPSALGPVVASPSIVSPPVAVPAH